MPDKIAIIRSSYSPFGGVETLTLDIIKELLRTGLKVTLITQPNQQWPLKDDKIQIVPIGINHGHRLWLSWAFNHHVNKYLSKHSFDCIFSLDRVSSFTHHHCGGLHLPYLKVQNEQSHFISRMFRSASLFHRYLLHIEEKGFGVSNQRLKKIQCCSQMIKNEFQEHYNVPPDKLMVIYNGIDQEKIKSEYERKDLIAQQLIQKHSLDASCNYLLFLGSGFSRKGLDIALEGLRFIPTSYHLLVVGKGKYKKYLRQLENLNLLSRVHFLGPQENGWRYASICKALVLPSRYEPFGIAVAEAQTMGIPVLVSDRTGYAELISPGITGVILKSPMTKSNTEMAFTQLKDLIEYPQATPYQIIDHIQELDKRVFFRKLIHEFLEIA